MPSGKILILTDGKAGHENQSRAFARALGREAVIVPVKFKSPLHKALSYLLDHLGIHTLSLFTPIDPKPETRNPKPETQHPPTPPSLAPVPARSTPQRRSPAPPE